MFTAGSRLAACPSRLRLTGHHAMHGPSHIHGIIPGGRGRCSSQRVYTSAPQQFFYGREFEKDRLGRVLNREPGQGDILLILGPSDCGKTAFLESFLEGRRHVLYVDCRGIDSKSPMTFTSALLMKLLPIAPRNQQQKLRELPSASATYHYLHEVFETLKEVFVAWKQEAQQPTETHWLKKLLLALPAFATLEKTFAAQKEEAQTKPTETHWPVLVIDEANVLMSWTDSHPAELRGLLQFFVTITKQKLCHVVMATAESRYPTWLNNQIGSGLCRREVIGNFPEGEARQFFYQLLGGDYGDSSSDGNNIDKDDKAWAAVYEVCGGNAHALGSLADRIQEGWVCDWEEALRQLWQVELGRVEDLSQGGDGFKAVHYAAAALKLLDSPQAQNTVQLEDMKELLGRYVEGAASKKSARVRAGAAVLDSMVQANALSVRPPSSWARDIPQEAYDNTSLVTAPSTMHLYCMRRIRQELESVLEDHDSVQYVQ